ncbi:hypothetical protein [Acinetobacter sp.]|uniref:hypothetical protein n=1 Tax=Acinetobacter sp. TaxID=472 RepID=UPI00388E0E56
MPRFGFTPSVALLNNIQYGLRVKNSGESLAALRYETAVCLHTELISKLLHDLVAQLPQSAARDTTLKLADYIHASVALMLKPLDTDVSHKIAKASIEFYGRSLFKSHTGQYQVGLVLDPRLYTNLEHSLKAVQADERIDIAALTETYKQTAESLVAYFITEFSQTLNFDMLQAKAWDTATSHLLKAIYIALDQIMPNLHRHELKIWAKHHLTQLHA